MYGFVLGKGWSFPSTGSNLHVGPAMVNGRRLLCALCGKLPLLLQVQSPLDDLGVGCPGCSSPSCPSYRLLANSVPQHHRQRGEGAGRFACHAFLVLIFKVGGGGGLIIYPRIGRV